MAPACVFAIVWHEGECSSTPWIFVNHNTSNAADPRHQNEGSVTAFKLEYELKGVPTDAKALRHCH